MLRGKGGRSDSKTPKTQQGNELTMEQLDQVAGGAATTPPLKDCLLYTSDAADE